MFADRKLSSKYVGNNESTKRKRVYLEEIINTMDKH